MMFDDSPLLQLQNSAHVSLKNLKESDVAEMVKSMLGKKRKTNEMKKFIKDIISHTRGNPLFIREMLYYLN